MEHLRGLRDSLKALLPGSAPGCGGMRPEYLRVIGDDMEEEESTFNLDPNQSTFMSGMMNPSQLSASLISSPSLTSIKSEPSIPEEPITRESGWTCLGKAKGCVTPSGKQFRSKRAALEHLLNTGAPMDQVKFCQEFANYDFSFETKFAIKVSQSQFLG